MKKIYYLFFCCVFVVNAQQNPFKTIQNNNNYISNGFVNAQETPDTDVFIASPILVTESNYKISGLNLTFNSFAVSEIENFTITVYQDNIGLPGAVVFTEEIHRNNYYCNKVEISSNQFNVDLFLRNPIDLVTGNYWFSLVAHAPQAPTSPIQLKTVSGLDYSTAQFDGTSWSLHTVDIAHKLYGMKNAPSLIGTFPYTQSFGAETLDGWQMTDLFPSGIEGFTITNTLWSETDTNSSSLQISGYDPLDSNHDRFIFYNVTTPKFKFLSGHTYRVSCKYHHVVFADDVGNMGAFGFVFVPDPPELGFLEGINGGSGGANIFNNDFSLDPTMSNLYFQNYEEIYTPSEDKETRLAMHMEFGAMPFDVKVSFWLDEFIIEDITNLGVEDQDVAVVKIYPNPTSGQLNISTLENVDYVEIYTMEGRKVLVSNQLDLDVSHLSNGIYLLKMKKGGTTLKTKLFIKE